MKNKIILAVLLISTLFLSACKEVDQDAVNAQKVHGTDNLYWFCDGDMLIVFEDVSGNDDEYEGMWLGGCYQGSRVQFKPELNGNSGGVTE